jgi:cytochrome oxidase Cu insertion factor (SCO1/SenC/PrrC family)
VFLFAAALGVFALVKRTSWLGAIPPIFAIVIGVFLPLTVSVSTQIVERDSVIEVGDAIPQFKSIDGQGQAFDSASLNGHLVLIKFFRAHW